MKLAQCERSRRRRGAEFLATGFAMGGKATDDIVEKGCEGKGQGFGLAPTGRVDEAGNNVLDAIAIDITWKNGDLGDGGLVVHAEG